MTINDYIRKHKDEDFKTFAFTEVDNLILSCIPYLDFTNIVPSFKQGKVLLNEAAKKIIKEKRKPVALTPKRCFKMIELMKDTKRYGDILLYNYVNIINDDAQFQAITMKLNDNSIYVAYAGTDSTIVGWKEDFVIAYQYPVFSQKYASYYLTKTLGFFQHHVRVGGHSKGGNLAICGVMNAPYFIEKKISTIYNNDGPGFLKEQYESDNYKKIAKKIKMYVPEQSIIGMILYHTHDYIVVKSKSFNILQHDAFTWQCNEKSFIKTTLSKRSKVVEKKLTEKLDNMTIEERINLVDGIFKIFKNLQIEDISDIKIRKLFSFVREFKNLDKTTQNLIVEIILITFIRK